MTNIQWEVVAYLSDSIEAEILRGLLQAQGVEVWLSQEGAARAIGLTVGPVGEIAILVPSHQFEQALDVLEAYDQGDYEDEAMDMDGSANLAD